ncbi:unnamed protein product [Linum trigynum]|uniref:Uncharacterized protein n=1 Tax=Linum trigynum TaxID=586398 RepID=A0AAV2GPU6_9ROSI
MEREGKEGFWALGFDRENMRNRSMETDLRLEVCRCLVGASPERRRSVAGFWKKINCNETSKGGYGCVEGDLRSVTVSTKSNSDVGRRMRENRVSQV